MSQGTVRDDSHTARAEEGIPESVQLAIEWGQACAAIERIMVTPGVPVWAAKKCLELLREQINIQLELMEES